MIIATEYKGIIIYIYIIFSLLILLIGIAVGVDCGIDSTKKAMTKTECARYNPTSGVIELKKNGAWQPFDTY